MKVLINIPGKGKTGGVLGHYKGLRKFLLNNNYYYNSNGNYKVKAFNILLFPYEIVKFCYLILIIKPELVVLNPSLYPGVFQRDSIYLKIAKIFKIKVVVFFHGWYEFYQNKLTGKYFNSYYGKADTLIVLSSKYKNQLSSWGFPKYVTTITTKVDDDLVSNLNIKNKKFTVENILFLARLEEYKGIFIALDAYAVLKKKYPNIRLTIVGDGSAKKQVVEKIANNNLLDVRLTGHISGSDLINEYKKSDLYIFPSFNEGLPASVLEAMAFGLPIISRNVGGLSDFFEQHKMGVLINSFDPNEFVLSIEEYIKEPNKVKEVSLYNYNYAKEHFLASKVASLFENFLSETANKN